MLACSYLDFDLYFLSLLLLTVMHSRHELYRNGVQGLFTLCPVPPPISPLASSPDISLSRLM